MGAPRLHGYLRNHCKNWLQSFLLDLDHRFHYFYDDEEFAWYNMCNNFFFDECQRRKFIRFLKIKRLETSFICFCRCLCAISRITLWPKQKSRGEYTFNVAILLFSFTEFKIADWSLYIHSQLLKTNQVEHAPKYNM